MLQDLAFKKFTEIFNKIIATDPLAQQELVKLHDQSLRIHILKTPFDFVVCFTDEGVKIHSAQGMQHPTVTLTGKPSALLRFAKTDAHTKMLMDKEINIKGDLDLLMQLKKIQARLLIDWEELLSQVMGDFAANRLMSVAKEVKQRLKQHFQFLYDDTKSYIHKEAELLPTEVEVEDFYQEIKQLRRDIERLEARMKLL